MNRLNKILIPMVLCMSGCTATALERYTLLQTDSAANCRDRIVMDCLATVAANPGALPSFALFANGVANVADTMNASTTVTWNALSTTARAVGFTAQRTPKGQWTISPPVEYERLEGLHAACLWVIQGPEAALSQYPGILGYHSEFLDDKPHLAVQGRLAKLPPHWLHIGRHHEIPACACHVAHCGHTWVWVMPEDSEAFAQFTLVLHDIATLDAAVITTPPLLVTLTDYVVTNIHDPSAKAEEKKYVAVASAETRAIKPMYKAAIEAAIRKGMDSGKVDLTRAQWLAYSEPWHGFRFYTAPTPTPSQLGRPQTVQLIPLPTTPGRLPSTPPGAFMKQ